jgi:hypothetical protein
MEKRIIQPRYSLQGARSLIIEITQHPQYAAKDRVGLRKEKAAPLLIWKLEMKFVNLNSTFTLDTTGKDILKLSIWTFKMAMKYFHSRFA